MGKSITTRVLPLLVGVTVCIAILFAGGLGGILPDYDHFRAATLEDGEVTIREGRPMPLHKSGWVASICLVSGLLISLGSGLTTICILRRQR